MRGHRPTTRPCGLSRLNSLRASHSPEALPPLLLVRVRSTSDCRHSALGRRLQLGFTSSPKRLNVTITRARHHLVIVGSAATLLDGPSWGDILSQASLSFPAPVPPPPLPLTALIRIPPHTLPLFPTKEE